jgi:hypothetical protein
MMLFTILEVIQGHLPSSADMIFNFARWDNAQSPSASVIQKREEETPYKLPSNIRKSVVGEEVEYIQGVGIVSVQLW